VVLALAVTFGIFGSSRVLTPVGYTLAIWIAIVSLLDPIDRFRRGLTLSRSIVGMTIAHLGLALFVVGITSVESYTNEHDIVMSPGTTVGQGGYQFRFVSLTPAEGPNYSGVRGEFVVSRNGEALMSLYPEKRQYWVQRSVQTEAGIGSNRGANILIALGEDVGAGKWSVRLQIRPLVNYVWIAAFVMALGGGIAASDRRYRIASRASDLEPAPAGSAAQSVSAEGRAG
jgi:cytochrome c-type biogenesis protein CcmF